MSDNTRQLIERLHKLYVELSFALVHDASGAVIGSVAVGRDCGDRFLAEKAMRERLAQLERTAT